MKIIKDNITSQSKYMEIHSTVFEDNNGQQKEWSWVSRCNDMRAVMVVPIIMGKFYWDEKKKHYVRDNRLVIIKEFRISLNEYEYSFPAGLIDQNESILEAASRELNEECGCQILKILGVSDFLINTAGLSNESISIVFAEVDGFLSNKGNESSEEIEIYSMNQHEVYNLLLIDNKFSAKSWLIMKYFAKYGDINLF